MELLSKLTPLRILIAVYLMPGALVAPLCFAEDDALRIAQAVYDRDDGKDSVAKVEMKLIESDGSEKLRVLESSAKDYGELSKRLIRFNTPESIRGTSFLSLERNEKSDDQFLYLPSIHRVRRIASDQKDRSFVNTDFSYEDLERRKVERDNYTLLRTEKAGEKDTWVLERRAKDSDDSQYGKVVMWVAKDSYVIVKAEMYDKKDALFKVLTVDELRQVDGVWTAMQTTMSNLEEKHKTVDKVLSVKYNGGVRDEIFTEAYMEQNG